MRTAMSVVPCAEPLQPPLRPSGVAILLMLMPAVAIFFRWPGVPVRAGPQYTQAACEHLACEENVAVVQGCDVSCVGVSM